MSFSEKPTKKEQLDNLPITKFERQIDRFFSWPRKKIKKFLERAFLYTYRECDTGSYALFSTVEILRKATRAVKEKGYTHFDCLTPFPVHGLEHDMGLKKSRLPYVTFFAGLLGFLLALSLQTGVHHPVISQTFSYFDIFPNLRSYPLNIGGKPTFSWPAMIPILFELTVLIGGLATVFFLILVSKLFRPRRKILHPDITNDKFCIWIPSDSKNYNQKDIEILFSKMDALEIDHISGQEKNISSNNSEEI